jgi:hypothetical protein
MATAQAILNKTIATLRKANATARPVKFRHVETTGGNATLGLGAATTVVDTDVDPQPAVEKVAAVEVAGSAGVLQLGDYRMTFAGTVDEATLQNDVILYGSDILKIKSYDPQPFQGVVIAWVVIARAVKA